MNKPRLEYLLSYIPFLKSFQYPELNKIISILEDEKKREMLDDDRLKKLEKLLKIYLDNYGDKKSPKNDSSKALKEDLIELTSDDDSEIEFYVVNKTSKKIPEPITSEENIIKIEDADSDVEIISDSDEISTKISKENSNEISIKEETSLFTRRNNETISNLKEEQVNSKILLQAEENKISTEKKYSDQQKFEIEKEENVNQDKEENLAITSSPKDNKVHPLSDKSLSELQRIQLQLEERLGLKLLTESPSKNSSTIRDPRLKTLSNNPVRNAPVISQQIISVPLNSTSFVPNPIIAVPTIPSPYLDLGHQQAFINSNQSVLIPNSNQHLNTLNTSLAMVTIPVISRNVDKTFSCDYLTNALPKNASYQQNNHSSFNKRSETIENQTIIGKDGTRYTKSKINFGEFIKQRNENNLKAEKIAREKAIREAESLGLSTYEPKELSSKIALEEEIKKLSDSYLPEINNNKKKYSKNSNSVKKSNSVTKTKTNSVAKKSTTKNNKKMERMQVSEYSSKENCEKNKMLYSNNIISRENTKDKTKKNLKRKLPESTCTNDINKKENKMPGKIKKRRFTYDPRCVTESVSKNIKQIEQKFPNKGSDPAENEIHSEEKLSKQKSNNDTDEGNNSIGKFFTKKIMGAIKEKLKDCVSNKQSDNIYKIIEDVIKQEEKKASFSSQIQNNPIEVSSNKKYDKSSKQNCKREASTNIKNNVMSRELRLLNAQLDGFYDRDQILALASKNRDSSKLALLKIQNKYKSLSDDESSKNNNAETIIPQSFPYINKQKSSEQNNYCGININKTKNIQNNDEEYDTDDFASHLKENVQKKCKPKYTRKSLLTKYNFNKELSIKIKKLTQADIERGKNPKKITVLKPLAVVPALSSKIENQKKNYQQQKNEFRNIDLKNHCKNSDFMKTCIICNKPFNDIVCHYVHFHSNISNHEVYCARLPYYIIEKYKYNFVKGELSKTKPRTYSVECIFCNQTIIGCQTELSEHYSTHTGEYAWECDWCDSKSAFKKDIVDHCKSFCEDGAKPKRLYVYKKELQINATYCTECYYIQLNKENVIRHLQKHHLITREPERLCENLILVKFLENSIIELNEIENEIENEFIEIQNELYLPNVSPSNNDHITSNDETEINNELMDISIDIKPDILEQIDEIFQENFIKVESIMEQNYLQEYEGEKNSNNSDDKLNTINSEFCSNFSNLQKISSELEESKKLDTKHIYPLKPWLNIKDFNLLKSINILSKTNLSDFFKCMICPYSNNNSKQMLIHLEKHVLEEQNNNGQITELECCYCQAIYLKPNDLINHIETDHYGCNFQCSRCFYRSCSSFSVKFHSKKYHKKFDKIILCNGPEISLADEINLIQTQRDLYFKPFKCHLCNQSKTAWFYLEKDFKNHFSNVHYNATFCECESHDLLSCLYCFFETNSIFEMRYHITHIHSNRNQYAACRLRNAKYKNLMSPSATATIIVNLSEVLQQKDFVPSPILKEKLNNLYENKKNFKLLMKDVGETVKNFSFVEQEISNYNTLNLKSSTSKISSSLEDCQDQFYELAKIVTSNTGLIGKDLLRCVQKNCAMAFVNFEQWLNHIKCEHAILFLKDQKYKCPHCSECHLIGKFNNHFNHKHAPHRFFCYLCGITNSTVNSIEQHLKIRHLVTQTKNKITLPANKYSQQYITVVPNEIVCDSFSLVLHMRNILSINSNRNIFKLPNYVPIENHRYKCFENNCSFESHIEDSFEDHFKTYHRTCKSFKCLHCTFEINEVIRDFYLIKNHLRMHAEILYACRICMFVEHQRQLMQNHVRTNHNIQESMMKIVRSRVNNEIHFEVETFLEDGNITLVLHYCLICRKELNQSYNSLKHLKEDHGISVVYICQYCKNSFNSVDEFIQHHIKNHTKTLKVACLYKYTIKNQFDNILNNKLINTTTQTQINSKNIDNKTTPSTSSSSKFAINCNTNQTIYNSNSNHCSIENKTENNFNFKGILRVKPIEKLINFEFIKK